MRNRGSKAGGACLNHRTTVGKAEDFLGRRQPRRRRPRRMMTPPGCRDGDGPATWYRPALTTSPQLLASPPDQGARPPGRGSAWTPTSKGPGIHGGWWPHPRDAAAELPALLTELSPRAGRASRIALQVDAFSNIPHQLTAGGRKVHVAWFRYMNPHTAILTMAGRDDLILLAVPPQASPAAAAAALRLAASGRQRRRHALPERGRPATRQLDTQSTPRCLEFRLADPRPRGISRLRACWWCHGQTAWGPAAGRCCPAPGQLAAVEQCLLSFRSGSR